MDEFFCSVVGEDVIEEVCSSRISQAKAMKERGEGHRSLFKCLTCTKHTSGPEEEVAAEEKLEESEPIVTEAIDDPICAHCGKPASAMKSQFNVKRHLHASCYQILKRDGKLPDQSAKPEEKKTTELEADKAPIDEEETVDIMVDLRDNPELYEKLIKIAKQELRTPEMQMLYMIREGLKELERVEP